MLCWHQFLRRCARYLRCCAESRLANESLALNLILMQSSMLRRLWPRQSLSFMWPTTIYLRYNGSNYDSLKVRISRHCALHWNRKISNLAEPSSVSGWQTWLKAFQLLAHATLGLPSTEVGDIECQSDHNSVIAPMVKWREIDTLKTWNKTELKLLWEIWPNCRHLSLDLRSRFDLVFFLNFKNILWEIGQIAVISWTKLSLKLETIPGCHSH